MPWGTLRYTECGAAYENQDIVNWSFANGLSLADTALEAASLLLIASGLLAIRRLRRP